MKWKKIAERANSISGGKEKANGETGKPFQTWEILGTIFSQDDNDYINEKRWEKDKTKPTLMAFIGTKKKKLNVL